MPSTTRARKRKWVKISECTWKIPHDLTLICISFLDLSQFRGTARVCSLFRQVVAASSVIPSQITLMDGSSKVPRHERSNITSLKCRNSVPQFGKMQRLQTMHFEDIDMPLQNLKLPPRVSNLRISRCIFDNDLAFLASELQTLHIEHSTCGGSHFIPTFNLAQSLRALYIDNCCECIRIPISLIFQFKYLEELRAPITLDICLDDAINPISRYDYCLPNLKSIIFNANSSYVSPNQEQELVKLLPALQFMTLLGRAPQ